MHSHFHATQSCDEYAPMKRVASITITNIFHLVRLGLTNRTGGLGLRNVRVSGTSLANQCPQPVRCANPNSKYRTADGSCNNVGNPEFGKSNTPVQRILPPTYDDGKGRVGWGGSGGSCYFFDSFVFVSSLEAIVLFCCF